MNVAHRAAAHTVLVVDDNDDIREAITITLTSEGCAVAAAGDVATALGRIRDGFQPCVVLLDLHMPGLDGWHFLDQRDRDPALGDVAVIVVSGDAEQRDRAVSRGCDFLLKPARVETLLATIATRCARHGGSRTPLATMARPALRRTPVD